MYYQTPDERVQRVSDSQWIPANPTNADWQAYQAWLAAGNTPSPMPVTPPTADDVRAEAQRRIVVLTGAPDIIGCLIKQHNAQMRATELTLIQAQGGTWTAEEAAEAAALQGLANAIKAIRAASNALELSPPSDYTQDQYWP